jgi:cytidylate kinase
VSSVRERDGRKILEAEEKSSDKPPLVYQGLYGAWLDRAAKHAKVALDARVEERQVGIAEREGRDPRLR